MKSSHMFVVKQQVRPVIQVTQMQSATTKCASLEGVSEAKTDFNLTICQNLSRLQATHLCAFMMVNISF